MESKHLSSRFFHLLAKHSKELMMLLDSNFCITDTNEIVSKIAQYDPSELINQSLQALLTPQSASQLTELISEFTAFEVQSRPIAIEMIKKAGGIVSLKGTISRISIEPGESGYLLNLQLEKTKNIFEGARTQLETLLANTEESFIVLDVNLTISIINEAGKIHSKAILGKEMKVGKSILDYADPDRLPMLSAMYNKVLNGEKISYEVPIGPNKDNIYSLKYIPIKNRYEEVNGIFIITENITEQKQHIAHIKESEFRFRSIFENIKDGAILSYTDGTNFAANAAILDLLGYTHDEFISKQREDLLDLGHPNIQVWLEEREKNGYWSGDLTAIDKNGEKIPVHVSNVIFEDTLREGNILSVFTVRDRREENKAEKERALIAEISHNLLSDYSFTQSLHELLYIVNRYFGFSVGEVWMPDLDQKRMKLKVSRCEDTKFNFIIEESMQVHFDLNEGFPSKCFSKDEVSFETDFYLNPTFHRKALFEGSGLRGVFCVPIHTKSERLGVCMFFVENLPVPKELEEIKLQLQNLSNQISPEIKLKKSEEEFRAFFETSPDLLGVAGKDGNFKKFNRAVTDLLGYTKEEILDGSFTDFIHPDDIRKTKELILQQFQTGSTRYFENRYITKEGSVVWIAWAAKVSKIDEVAYLVGKNITEKKAIEKELSLKQKALEAALTNLDRLTNNSPDIICTISIDGRFISVNNASEKILGYTAKELQGRKFIDFVLEEDREMTLKMEDEINSGTPTTNFDNRYISKNGEVVPLSWSCYFLEQDQLMYCVARDGRQKQNQEAKIKEVNEKLTDVLENTGDGFAGISNDYKITYWNKLAERYSGLSRDKVLGRDIRELAYIYSGEKFYSELDRVMQSRKISRFEDYIPNLDYWYSTSIYPTDYGISIFVRNITKEKKGMELLQASNERYEMVFKASNEAIYDWDILTDNLMFGDGYSATYGYEGDTDMLISDWIQQIHSEDLEWVENELDKIILEPESVVWKAEYRYKKANGEYAIVSDTGHIIRNKEGKAIRMVGSMRDVTVDKEYEKRLEELNVELANQAKELARSNNELERFAYVASHDLQEPLRMITSFLQLLEKRYNDLLDDKGRQYIHFAVDGAARMKDILVDLLEYSRIGKKNEKLQEVNLNEIVARVVRNLKSGLEEIPEATINVDDLPIIQANKTEMIQLFQNLLSNAIKYRGNEPPAISVINKSSKAHWLIGVHDNGIGIDKLYFDRIFIIFQRLHSGKNYKGTGIGLAICKKIIDSLNGKIWVESEIDKGSTFWVQLPK